ncbi:energy transducer TonB, partial [Mesorhizobium sp. M7A.F.Ca.US.003.02.2.1]
MTQAVAVPSVQMSRFGWRDLGLWAGAAALVLGAHVAVAYAVQNLTMVTEADGGPPPAQVIEMAPMVVMPAVQEQVAALDAVTPDQTEPTPTIEPTPEEPVEKAKPVVEPPEAVAPDEAEPNRTETAEQADQPPPDEVIPDVVEAVTPDVVIPLPQPKPVEIVKDKKPVEAKAKKPVEKPKPRLKKEKA